MIDEILNDNHAYRLDSEQVADTLISETYF